MKSSCGAPGVHLIVLNLVKIHQGDIVCNELSQLVGHPDIAEL